MYKIYLDRTLSGLNRLAKIALLSASALVLSCYSSPIYFSKSNEAIRRDVLELYRQRIRKALLIAEECGVTADQKEPGVLYVSIPDSNGVEYFAPLDTSGLPPLNREEVLIMCEKIEIFLPSEIGAAQDSTAKRQLEDILENRR